MGKIKFWKGHFRSIYASIYQKVWLRIFYKARRKLFLTSWNKRRRVAWAKSHLSWTPSQWKKVLWTDKSIFEVSYGNISRKVIRKTYEANGPSCYKGVVHKASSVIGWGFLAANGVGNLHFFTGTIKVPDSIRVLEVNLRPSVQRLFGRKRYLFQQDNARSHTAKITRTKHVPVLEWPAASPDLSPIENIWRILKRNMAQRRPRNIQQLQDYLRQEWEKISTDTLNRLVSSMPKRLAAVIRRKDIYTSTETTSSAKYEGTTVMEISTLIPNSVETVKETSTEDTFTTYRDDTSSKLSSFSTSKTMSTKRADKTSGTSSPFHPLTTRTERDVFSSSSSATYEETTTAEGLSTDQTTVSDENDITATLSPLTSTDSTQTSKSHKISTSESNNTEKLTVIPTTVSMPSESLPNSSNQDLISTDSTEFDTASDSFSTETDLTYS
ncbi:Transposable element Tc1 transposase, partial [Araneus ventricosus]